MGVIAERACQAKEFRKERDAVIARPEPNPREL
jgi:hypothetical protein